MILLDVTIAYVAFRDVTHRAPADLEVCTPYHQLLNSLGATSGHCDQRFKRPDRGKCLLAFSSRKMALQDLSEQAAGP